MPGTNRDHKVKSDYGSLDYYRFFKKNNKDQDISRTLFTSIIRDYNEFLSHNLTVNGSGLILPCKIGKVEIRKRKTGLTIDKDGNITNDLPVNWQETRKLWNSNDKERKKRTKIRFTNEHTGGHTFRIVYFRSTANYKNKSVYKLQFNRDMKRNLSKSIFEGRIDAFIH